MAHSLVSTHAVLTVQGGAFVSLTAPPERWRGAAGACRNVGTWPVLVGQEGETDTVLCSPIILYDYPRVAPESPGDLFDGTEIDEILTLRIMAMTDEEKREAAGMDERTRAMLERTESLAREQLLSLHGAVRGVRPAGSGGVS
jgi:hydrogenase maturation protease